MSVIGGIDEVGRGCVMGPLIFCLIVNKSSDEITRARLKNLGVTDSKEIKSAQKIRWLANEIESITDVYFSTAPPELIDSYVNRNSYNDLSVNLVIELIDKVPSLTSVCIDSLGNSNSYEWILKRRFPTLDIKVIVRAELNDVYCAAASICAKNYRNNLFSELNKSYIVGSGYPADPITKNFIDTHLYDIKLRKFPFIRYSWETIKRLL